MATLAGGVRVVAVYAHYLAARGHQVTVVSLPRTAGWTRRLKRTLRGRGWARVIRPPHTHFDGLDVDHRVLEDHRPVTDADLPDADVVVATWWETAGWVEALSPSKGAKAYFVQGDERELADDPRDVVATWRTPAHKIVVSDWLEPLLREHGARGPVSVVHNAVDTDHFSAPRRGKQAAPTVGMIYSHLALKGSDVALAAYEKAKQELPGLGLLCLGKDAPGAHLPLPDGARHVHNPPQDKLPGVYAACDAWLFASRREGFGLPILEAMACRTPVIATPAGAAPQLLEAGGGVLVGPEDSGGMAAAILEVCGLDDAAWRAMSDRAHATAAVHTWQDAADRFERELYRAAESTPGPGDGHAAAAAPPQVGGVAPR